MAEVMDRPHGMAPHLSWPWATVGEAKERDVQIRAKNILDTISKERDGRALVEKKQREAAERREALRAAKGIRTAPYGGRNPVELLNESLSVTRSRMEQNLQKTKHFQEHLTKTEAENAAREERRHRQEKELSRARAAHDSAIVKKQEAADKTLLKRVQEFDKKNEDAMQRSRKVLDTVSEQRSKQLKQMAQKREAELKRASQSKTAIDEAKAKAKLELHAKCQERRELKDFKEKSAKELQKWKQTREEARSSRAQHIEALNLENESLRKKLHQEYITRVNDRAATAAKMVEEEARKLRTTNKQTESSATSRMLAARNARDDGMKKFADAQDRRTKQLERMKQGAQTQRARMQVLQRMQIRERYYATELEDSVTFRKKLQASDALVNQYFDGAQTI